MNRQTNNLLAVKYYLLNSSIDFKFLKKWIKIKKQLIRGKVAPPRPPRTKIKHFHGQQSEDIEAGLGEKLNTV